MKLFVTTILTAILISPAFNSARADEATGLPPGALSEESLGQILNAIGLKPMKTDKRYDFAFKTSIRGEEWKFSMSAVLSRNSESVWIMAWLDEVPKTADAVPRTALLRLLAANDRMGNGKFFAYIPTNKRFVLQRVLKNQNMSTKKITETLQDLAVSVADEFPIWNVANWKPKTAPQPRIATGGSSSDNVPIPRTNANQSQPRLQTSEANSRYSERRVQ